MNDVFLILHNWLRWAVLIAGIWTVVRAIRGLAFHNVYTKADNKSNLFFMIFMDLQFLIGLILYFIGPWFNNLSSGASDIMTNPETRFFTVEHASMMIIAWILVHVGRMAVKKSRVDIKKHRKSLIYFGIALLLILIAIPWPFRVALGYHPWLRF